MPKNYLAPKTRPLDFAICNRFPQQEKERPKAALKNTTFGLKSLYFKPFDGYPYFAFDINTTVSTWLGCSTSNLLNPHCTRE